MGGTTSSNNNKQPSMPREGAASFHKLEEDITCSVCLSELTDPVSIACGHTFCEKCISSYWDTPQLWGYRCPECRKVCPRDQLIPVHRLKNLISKVQLVVKEELAKKETPAHAIPLVYTDSDGHLQTDEATVESCFLGSDVSDYPVVLICVIGEKRRGKSFLLNYILRALSCQERGQPISLGAEDEPLCGFDWSAGTESITKGIWIWNKPFILERNGEKMAVFVLDTEGSLDIEGSRDTSIKLSALSMILSSYLIFNVNSSLKRTELDYLEMYLYVAELAGKSFDLQYLQHLDLLIRDWHDSLNCRREDGQSYINRETETMRKTSQYPFVLDTLRSPSVSCCLLPHPGKKLLGDSQGRISDMDDDFRNHLRNYITDLVRGIWRHVKTDIHGEKVTCAQLEAKLKEFVGLLQKEQYSFASPLEMFFTFENRKNMASVKREFLNRIDNLAPASSSLFKILGVTPNKMKSKTSEAAAHFLAVYEESIKGDGSQDRQLLMDEMKSILLESEEKFHDEYSKRFKKCAIGIGCAVGGGILSLAGGVAGAAVAGTVLAAEAVALMGSTTAALITGAVGGTVTLGAIGTGVGAGVGAGVGEAIANRKAETEQGTAEDGGDGSGADIQLLVAPEK
ncbi:RING finger protein 112 [Xenopus laevis]|uniref:RING-type domain-containing protein n=2 Tax=Xenopus laevis TaxID=8355 RepID=A0A974H227_XENLA|nr:RING finger protein 112 [Xenopus laevis]OCT61952.1 hypothetical protein XELAEV_18047985mg [Xenopus laevis]